MKKIKLKFLAASIFLSISAIAQPPTGTPPATNTAARAAAAWYRGGNFPIGSTPPGANIFGTMFNSPIYTYTNSVNRTRLNGTLTTTINAVNQNVDGYFGISPSGYFANNTPVAMLHLYGANNTFFGIGGGWRSWMKTGAFMNENSDAMYVGMKPEAGTNRSDAVIG
jgi:hypothetical protein